MKRKILFLGGSHFQIPPIKYAKEQGHFVITCDYLPDNPGHKLADEYYNVSTTDMEGVLKLAQKLRIDGIVAYASDPAAPTQAYVGNRLGLPSNPYESVKILSLQVMSKIDTSARCEPLSQALVDNDNIVRQKVSEILIKLNDSCFLEPLMVALNDRDKKVRINAAKALENHQNMKALPSFIAALQDKEKEVRRIAARALGYFQNNESSTALMAASSRDLFLEPVTMAKPDMVPSRAILNWTVVLPSIRFILAIFGYTLWLSIRS